MKWPSLKSYDQNHLGQIGQPLGGIGTGTISLGGRGQLFDWEIQNRPQKNSKVSDNFLLSSYGGDAFFTLYAKQKGKEPVQRVLEGQLAPPHESSHGSDEAFHGLPRFQNTTFDSAYPLAQVHLSDPKVPVKVRLEAFNPLIPTDADRSGIPVAVLRYVLTNKTNSSISATLCGTMRNRCAGSKRKNKPFKKGRLQGIHFTGSGGNSLDQASGDMAITVLNGKVSRRPEWEKGDWRTPLLHFWNDLLDDGKMEPVKGERNTNDLYASLASSVNIPPKGTVNITFLITWRFPNRYNWFPEQITGNCCDGGSCFNPKDLIGNYYSEQYRDSIEVAEQTAKALPHLEKDTLTFVNAFLKSDLPKAVKEAALFNVSTLRSQTCFRTPDGFLYGWEGCSDQIGCCEGSCTHVWNYETTTPYLFGDLARGMRRIEFTHATHPKSGRMSFRVKLPLSREKGEGAAAADGQMGCIMKMYREWRLSGDQKLLTELWPKIKKSLEFCWIKGGWDANKDGVMEGCQHNTMDVEYYGPNPQMGTWYLGALRAAEEMAKAMGDANFASECRRLFQSGRDYMDEHLFNGEYYEHIVQPAKSWNDIAKGLTMKMGAEDPTKPRLQLGSGCLVDQLVGQYMAHVCGLGYLTKKSHVKKTLKSIMKYNFRADLHEHFNNMRTYALNDEAALLMASFPKGDLPEDPFPYFNEVMTGFEYTAATHMLFENQRENGLKCIESIRARYDGLRRNPFNEAECGHHYARAMAAWSGILALSGFQYNGVDGIVRFANRDGHHFWSTGDAYGTCRIKGQQLTFNVIGGNVLVSEFDLGKRGKNNSPKPRLLKAGNHVSVRLTTV